MGVSRHGRRLAALALALVACLAPGQVAAQAPWTGLSGAAPAAPAPALQPSPADARLDRERLWEDGCLAFDRAEDPRTCVYGDPDSSFTVALVGDSHLSHLFPGFQRLANRRGWRLVVYVKSNCPFLDIPIWNRYLERAYTECATWNTKVLRRLKADPPDLTFTLAFRGITPMDDAKDTAQAEGRAIGRMLRQVPGRRAVIVDTPYSYRDVPDCLIANPGHVDRCAIPRYQVLSLAVRTREQKAAEVGHATYVDLTSRICGGFPCRVVTDTIVMFRDRHHLTATYAATLSGALGRAADRALD